jgi:hypothetical protein
VGLARGEKDSAQGYFSLALEEFEALKAVPYIERTQAVLETLIGLPGVSGTLM